MVQWPKPFIDDLTELNITDPPMVQLFLVIIANADVEIWKVHPPTTSLVPCGTADFQVYYLT